MSFYLIEPDSRSVRTFTVEGDFLDNVRKVLDAPHVTVQPIADLSMAVWVDGFGMFKSGRAFWRFNDAPQRFSGAAVLTRLDEYGMPAEFKGEDASAAILNHLVFYPPEALERISEELTSESAGDGRRYPTVQYQPIWQVEKPEDRLGAEGYSVYEDEPRGYVCIGFRLDGETGLRSVKTLYAATLEEIRSKLPPGLLRIEPAADEALRLVEHWVVRTDPG